MGKADYKAIGKRMQEVRIDRKMTQQEMADTRTGQIDCRIAEAEKPS